MPGLCQIFYYVYGIRTTTLFERDVRIFLDKQVTETKEQLWPPSQEGSAANTSSILVGALPPHSACREKASRLVPGVPEKQRDDAVSGHRSGREVPHSRAIVCVRPQVLDVRGKQK